MNMCYTFFMFEKENRLWKNTSNWTTYPVLETLNLSNILETDLYEELNYFRQIRNIIVHEGIVTDKETSTNCYRLSKKVMIKELGL